MKNNRVFILVVILSIVTLIGLLFSVYKVTSVNKKEFLSSGYVNVYELEDSRKIYFSEGTEYKSTYKDTVKFNSSTNEKNEVSKYSFVIYENKNIGYLNNGVLMNLDNLNEDFIPYYNIKSNYLIKYLNGSYIINTLNEDIKFNNFIGKISDTKYIIAGNDVKLITDGKEYSSFYFEVSFEEKNVIRIVNDLVDLTTVNENTYLMVGSDIKIDLINQKIVYKDEDKLYLNEITITNDENIDIKYDEESDKSNVAENKTIENQDINEDNQNKNMQQNNDNNNDNNVNTYKTKTVIDYKTNPYLELLNVNVSSSRISLKFNVQDPNKMITNDAVTIVLKDLQTGNSETKPITLNENPITFEKDNLTSNHQYLVTIYTKYDKDYTLILLQRTFTTNKIGLDLNLDYVSSSSLDYMVSLTSESLVEAFDVNIYKENNDKLTLVDTLHFSDLTPNKVVTASFEGLDSNTEYITRVENVIISGTKYESGYAASDERKTLKTTPYDLSVVSTPAAKVNKKENTVTLDATSITDPDDAFTAIEYNIYQIDGENYNLLKTIKKASLDEFTLDIKNLDGFDNTKEYAFDVKITSYDNEKIITYTTDKSNSFAFTNKIFPSATFEKIEVLNNYIEGKFLIYDPDNAITNNDVVIKYTDTLGNSQSKNATISIDEFGDKYVDVQIDGLTGLTTYVVELYANVDVASEDKPAGEYQLGAVRISTEKSNDVNVSLEDKVITDADSLIDVFKVNLKLEVAEGTDEEIAANMTEFTIQLYSGHDASGYLLGTIKVNNNIKAEYFDNEKELTLTDFSNDSGTLSLTKLKQYFLDKGMSIPKNYSLKLIKGNSSLGYIEFKETGSNRLNFDINDSLLELDQSDATINVEQIQTSGLITALKVTAEFTANKDYAKSIVMIINDVTDSSPVEVVNETFLLTELNHSVENQYSYTFNFNDDDYLNKLKRGRVYKVSYYIKLEIGESIYNFPFGSEIGPGLDPNLVTSDEIIVLKEEPAMILYPILSTQDSVVYKYKITDNDLSYANSIKYTVNDNDYTASDYTCEDNNGFSCFLVDNLNKDDEYEIYMDSKLVERANYETTKTSVNTFNFDGTIENVDSVTYEVLKNNDNGYLYNNMFAVKISDSSESVLDKIAYYTLSFEQNNKKLVIDNINDLYISTNKSAKRNYNEIYILDNSSKKILDYSVSSTLDSVAYITECEDEGVCLYFDYAKLFNETNLNKYKNNNKTTSDAFINLLSSFKNTDLTITLSASYDSGQIDLQNTSDGYYALKVDNLDDVNENYKNRYLSFSNENISGRYYKLNAFESKFKYTLNSNSLNLTNYSYLYYNIAVSQNINYNITNRGLELSTKGDLYVPVTIRKINTDDILPNGDSTFKITKIVPGITVNQSSPTISGIKLNLSLTGYSSTDVYDEDGKYLYLFVSNNDSNVITSKIDINNLNGVSLAVSNDGELVLPESDNIWFDVTGVYNASNVKIDESNYSYDYLTGTFKFNEDYYDQTVTIKYKIVIKGLNSSTNYTLTAGLKLGEDKISYLVDNKSSVYAKFASDFTTLSASDINVSNIQSTITSNDDYTGRYINISYNIADIIGIENLYYELTLGDNEIDSGNYKSLESCYKTYGGTCLNFNGSSYTANFSVFAKYLNKDKDEFVYGTNYTFKLYADSTKNTLITEDTFDIRSLVDPTFNVIKKSNFKNDVYSLKFTVSVSDPDKVIAKPDGFDSIGYYNAYISKASDYSKDTSDYTITDGDGNSITSDYFDARDNNVIVYSNLTEATRYSLIIKYNTYKNNEADETKTNNESELYTIYTLNNYGISPGLIDYDGSNTLQTTYLRFSYASNIQKAEIINDSIKIPDPNQEAYTIGISYTVSALNKAYSFSNNVLYNKDEITSINDIDINELSGYSSSSVSYITGSVVSDNVGDSYYELTFPTTYLTDGSYGYQIEFDFYISGNMIDSTYPTKESCQSVPTNLWIKYNDNTEKCAILSNLRYIKEKNIGGAQ